MPKVIFTKILYGPSYIQEKVVLNESTVKPFIFVLVNKTVRGNLRIDYYDTGPFP